MTITMRVIPRRMAAPAPATKSTEPERGDLPGDVEQMCLDWGRWVASRRMLAPPPLRSVLGQLRSAASTAKEPPNVRFDAAVAAFHLALKVQPEPAQAAVYAMYAIPAITRQRVHVKRIAEALGVSRRTVYRLADAASTKAYRAHFAVLDEHRRMLARVSGERELTVD